MSGKTKHGFENCKDCRTILLLITDLENESIRFNQLLRLCKKTIDQKYSPPRLHRHLDGLEGKLIKRTAKSSQEVYYSPSFPKNLLDLEKSFLIKEAENLNKFPLDQIVRMKLRLYQMIGLEQNIADIECFLKIITPQERSKRVRFMGMMVEMKSMKYEHAMNSRTKSEYIEVLMDLKNQRDKIKKED